MNYTLHQLQIFLKIIETKSITKASQELFLTQPAISIQLKNFQNQFEIPLTEVLGKQIFIEIDRDRAARRDDLPAVGQRIDLADLKERIRKLEAIAAGVDF